MRRYAILAVLVAVLATNAEAGKGGKGGGGGGGGSGGGVQTNCGYGCLPTGGTVCVDLSSKAADGSYLAISPSTPSLYIGQRVVLSSEVLMTKVVACWKIQGT